MNDENGPFAPKRYGYGSGWPISWQGWAVSLVYCVAVFGAALYFVKRPIAVVAILVPMTVALSIISARTTRGGWRWRWGSDD